MKFCWMTAVAAIALAITSAAQTVAANSGQASKPTAASTQDTAEGGPRPAGISDGATRASNTQVLAELKQSLNAKKVHVGDPVKATVTQDVLIHGQIAIARGSKLVGRVTETRIRSDNDKESFLGVVFDKAVLKGGREIQFNGTIAALAAPARMTLDDRDPMLSPPGSIIRDNVGGPQQAPTVSSPPRGTGLPSTDTPLNPANSAIGSAARMGRETGQPAGSKSGAGLLSAGSRGVLGLPGLTLRTDPTGGHGSVISCLNHNVVLQSGTQMLIQVTIPIREQ